MNNILGAISLGLVTLFAGFAIVSTANQAEQAWADSSIAASSAGDSMDPAIRKIKGQIDIMRDYESRS